MFIAALHTIGQTPRPDLIPIISSELGIEDIVVTGALDPMKASDIPSVSMGDFPLETKLKDGSRVEVGAAFLQPLIQAQIDRVDSEVDLHIVLCAGPFPQLKSDALIIRPFEHACGVFKDSGFEKLIVIVPFEKQSQPAAEKWANAGFNIDVHSMDSREDDVSVETWMSGLASGTASDALVLDYVGYSKSILDKVQKSVSIPVIDLGHLAIGFAREVMQESATLTNQRKT